MCSHFNPSAGHLTRPAALLAVVCSALWLGAAAPVGRADVLPGLQLTKPKSGALDQEEKESLSRWRQDVKERLRDSDERVNDIEAQENAEPPATLKRRIELLSHIETTLSQIAAEEEVAKKTQKDLGKLQAELDEFLQHGFGEGERITFLELDEERDDLEAEQRRLARRRDKQKSANSAFEQAQRETKQQSSARRRIREKVEGNDKDALRQQLGEQLAEAMLLSESADATSRLRKDEVNNASHEVRLQQLRINLLVERVARMQTRAVFGTTELDELLMELDRDEDDLESDIAEAKADETKLKYLEDQWIRAQRQFDESTGNTEALREEIAAHQLGRRMIQERLPILQKQSERLTSDREIWKRRQKVFNNAPTREDVRQWLGDSEKSLGQLGREQRTAIFEIEELKNQLEPLKERQNKVSLQSPEAYWIEQQVANLRILLETQEQNLSSIRASAQLDRKLLDEMENDSLADTAKNRLTDLWNLFGKVWHYELTAFGEKSVTVQKVVTALLILLIGQFVSRALSRALRRQVLRRLDFDPSASATIQSLFYYTLIVMFGLFALNVAKVPLTAFTVLGGAVALGIGFGSQNIINNFISGLVLMAERPVKVGDLVQIDNLYGNVEHIGARSTRVRTGSNLEIIVPNSSFLQNNVINFTLSSNKVRTSVEVGVVYGSPTVTVTQLLRRATFETSRVARDPPPTILFKSFGDNALVFEVHFWIHMRTMMDQSQIESEVRFRIDQFFRDEGIVIAFPQSDVHLDMNTPLTVRMIDNS